MSLSPLPLGIDGLKLKIAEAIETVYGNMSEGIWDELGICRSCMEPMLNNLRVRKTSRVCHSNDTSHNCIAVILPLV